MKYIISLWKRIFDYKGTSGRKEFWVPFAVNAGLAVLMAVLCYIKFCGISWLAVPIIILAVYLAASAVPFISLTVRRLHDTGRSGRWYWLVFAFGVGAIVLIMMLAGATQSFDPSDNLWVSVYGPPPYEDDYDPEDNINEDVYGPPEYFEDDYDPETEVQEVVYGPPSWFETETDAETEPAETEITAAEPNAPVNDNVTEAVSQTESETETKETKPPEETAAEPEETEMETETEQDIPLEPFESYENIMPAVYGPPDWFE
ncbi:MAG: DUF805 domain-containing protein [Oscillospiraceae bacterium]